ncbi:MAG: UDP-N-acetylmuramate:L-alanyl-gamma-D-glutamyl-meso-diaminopimelate ligase [Verrucomicrobia bacterium]|nr:UDP-N-acetylmuramate:L-alanyl-gamma-D-glutamyl-meso-diaminopimelate ligase [Verrucomicrobiota bacterium]
MPKPVHRIHFLGICGTAMGSVAAAFRELGFAVTGSDDNAYPPMSTFLEGKGIKVCSGFTPGNIPAEVDLVVVGNALCRGNPELEAVLDRKLPYRSLPETLRDYFLQGKTNIVVTGTHGKTTTTSLITWIFCQAACAPGFLIGGIARDLARGATFGNSNYFILEGDEYDTAFFDKRSKFLHYLPETVVINNIEFDHADIFADLDEIKLSFRRLVNIVPGRGSIFINADDRNCAEVVTKSLSSVFTVGFREGATHRITGVRYNSTGAEFVLGEQSFKLPLIGEFNVRNAAMAVSVALAYRLPIEVIQDALARFAGVARRQELRGEVNGIKVIDDFAHHPTAIRETLFALRHRYPGHRIWAIFEPRSNTTRRAIFQTALPEALKLADGVILARVARVDQLPREDRLDPERVIQTIQAWGIPAFYEPEVEDILHRVKPLARPGDVIVVFSNGGFEGIHQRLLTELAAA